MIRYRCPVCGCDDRLWRGLGVAAFESVDARLRPRHGGGGLFWEALEPNGDYGCAECDWEGRKEELVRTVLVITTLMVLAWVFFDASLH
jgi:hypothetical protein